LWRALHADKQTTAVAVTARPLFDIRIELFPAPQIEVTNAEIGPFGQIQGFSQGREELLLYIVEDAGHRFFLSLMLIFGNVFSRKSLNSAQRIANSCNAFF
jgi:hypothetical protein